MRALSGTVNHGKERMHEFSSSPPFPTISQCLLCLRKGPTFEELTKQQMTQIETNYSIKMKEYSEFCVKPLHTLLGLIGVVFLP